MPRFGVRNVVTAHLDCLRLAVQPARSNHGFREVQEWKFSNPIYIGDTIHVELEVLETKAMPRLGGGLVTIKLTVKNQKGETAKQGTWLALMLSQP